MVIFGLQLHSPQSGNLLARGLLHRNFTRHIHFPLCWITHTIYIYNTAQNVTRVLTGAANNVPLMSVRMSLSCPNMCPCRVVPGCCTWRCCLTSTSYSLTLTFRSIVSSWWHIPKAISSPWPKRIEWVPITLCLSTTSWTGPHMADWLGPWPVSIREETISKELI